jgi:hypothetical protein
VVKQTAVVAQRKPHGPRGPVEFSAITRRLIRDRRAASASERARIAVTHAIRLAIDKISENDLALGRLLAADIKTGIACSYMPDARLPITWRL